MRKVIIEYNKGFATSFFLVPCPAILFEKVVPVLLIVHFHYILNWDV